MRSKHDLFPHDTEETYRVQFTGHELGAQPLRIPTTVGVAPVHRRRAVVGQRGVDVLESGRHGCGAAGSNLLLIGDAVGVGIRVEVHIVVVAADGAIVLRRVGAVVRARADGDLAAVGAGLGGDGGLVLGGVGEHTVHRTVVGALERAGDEVIARVGSLLAGDKNLIAPSARVRSGEVLAGAVGRINNLLVGRVLYRATRSAINNLQVQAVRALAARNCWKYHTSIG